MKLNSKLAVLAMAAALFSAAACDDAPQEQGKPFDELPVLTKVNARMPEPTYTSFNEGDEFVEIYTGFDEDFVYKVPRSQYLGDSQFTPDAAIARVVVINSMG